MSWSERLLNVFRRDRVADEIDEELQFHVESRIADNRAAGMTPDQARRDALRRFGNAPALREDTRDADVFLFLDHLRQDAGFALRSLRKRPAFAVVALLTLALGIGATTAIFTVVRSVLLRPLPFADPESLHVVSYTRPGGPSWLYPSLWDGGYLAFRDANRTFHSLATFGPAQATLTGAGDATRLIGAIVTTDFFRVLGVAPRTGRAFGPEDDAEGAEKVVLIGDGLWRRQFGADPRIVSQAITLNGVNHRVVGVMPEGFSYPAEATYWIPLTVKIQPNIGYARPVIGRLKPGVTRDQAKADLDVWVASLPPDPRRARDSVARVIPLRDAMVGEARLPLLVLGAAVGFVLVIVCANVANLLLMRAVARRQEIATRLALGASRGRLVRQLLTESAMLSVAGGVAGTLLAMAAGPALLSIIPAGRVPKDLVIRPDVWVLAFTAGLSLVTGLVVGLAPIAQTTRDGQFGAIREGTASATRRSHGLRHALVVAQVSLTLVLLVGAGLLFRSFTTLRSVPLGFNPDRVMTMTVDLPRTRYATAESASLVLERVLETLTGLPDAKAVGAVNWLPLGDMAIWGDVQAEDRRDLVGKYNATKVAVSPGYFDTVGIRVVRGRTFTAADRTGSLPVLIVSESVSTRLWPGGDPIGKRMALREDPKPGDWLTVVGVVEDVRQGGFHTEPTHAVYQPFTQVTNRYFVGYMTFLVRTSGDPSDAAPMMRAALQRVDKDEAPQAIESLEAVVDRTVAEPKFQARVLGAFSLAALGLAALGIYGVLAASVLERRFEIGVRMALGADRASVVRMILRRTLVLTVAGIALGLSGSFALTGALEKLLFNVEPTDTPTFVTAVVVLVAAAMAAALVPARRASSIDPLIALRAE